MFTTNIYRNEELSNIKFSSNAVVLILDSVSSTGNRTTKVLSFDGCKDTKDTTIVKHLLKCMLAEFNVCNDFNEQFSTFETGTVKDVNGTTFKEVVKTGIKAKKYFQPFLNSSTIYKTDSKGKLSHAVKCEDGVLLKDTALNIRQEQLITLFGYNSKQFRSALHHTATAILEQCKFVTLIKEEYNSIEDGLQEVAKQEQEQKQEQQKQEQEQKQENLKKTGTDN